MRRAACLLHCYLPPRAWPATLVLLLVLLLGLGLLLGLVPHGADVTSR